jgi:hypothetical protein
LISTFLAAVAAVAAAMLATLAVVAVQVDACKPRFI